MSTATDEENILEIVFCIPEFCISFTIRIAPFAFVKCTKENVHQEIPSGCGVNAEDRGSGGSQFESLERIKKTFLSFLSWSLKKRHKHSVKMGKPKKWK